MKKTVIDHLYGDIKGYYEEADEDKALIKKLRGGKKKPVKKAKVKKVVKKSAKKLSRKQEDKVGQVMREFAEKKLHSSSKKGPKVKSRKQALAIALSEAKRGPKRKKAKKK